MNDLSNYSDADLANAAGIPTTQSTDQTPVPVVHAQALSNDDLQTAAGISSTLPANSDAPYGTVSAPASAPQGFWDRLVSGATGTAKGMLEDIGAAEQGTSPVTAKMSGPIADLFGVKGQGAYLRQPIGILGYDENMNPVIAGQNSPAFDPKTMVALTDPSTGRMTAFYRNADTDEGGLTSLGRLLGLGTMTTAPEAAAMGQASAAGTTATAPITSADRLAQFDAAGVSPTLADVTQSTPIQTAQTALTKVPFAGGVVSKAANQQLQQLAARADQVASSFGPASTPEEAGSALQNGLNDYAGNFLKQSADNYAKVPIDPDTPAVLDSTKDALQGISSRISSNPDLAAQIVNPKFKSYLDALDAGNGLSYGDARQFRTFVGPYTQGGALVSDVPTGQWKQLYGALSDDLTKTAQSVSPEAAQAAQAANDFHRQGMQTIEDNLSPIANAGSSEKAYNKIIAAASNGGSADMAQVRAVQAALSPDQFGNVASTYLRQMGAPKPGSSGAPFSPSTFATNYAKLSDPAKDALFGSLGSTTRQQAESLNGVSQLMRNTEKMANHSNSAAHGLGLAGLFEAFHDPSATTLATMAGSIGTGYAGAKALTNPAFVRGAVAVGGLAPDLSGAAAPAMQIATKPLPMLGQPAPIIPFGAYPAQPSQQNQR